MADETPTREQLNNELKVAGSEHETALKAHADALTAMERARGDRQVTMEALVELADAVHAAKAAADRKAATMATLKRRIDNFDIIAKRGERETLTTSVETSAKAVMTDDLANKLRATGVDRITVTFDLVQDGKPVNLVSTKPTGAKLTAVSGRTSGGNGRGFRSAGKVTVNGTEYASLNKAYISLRAAKDGVAESDVTPANSKSAESWLTKNGYTVG